MLNCNKEFPAGSSYADYHIRYQIPIKQIPIKVAPVKAGSVPSIREAQMKAIGDSDELADEVDDLPDVDSLGDHLLSSKNFGSANGFHGGKTEEAHRRKTKPGPYVWKDIATFLAFARLYVSLSFRFLR